MRGVVQELWLYPAPVSPNRPITPLLAAFLPLPTSPAVGVSTARFVSYQVLMENTFRNIQTQAEDVNKDSRFVVSVTIFIPCVDFVLCWLHTCFKIF